MKILMLSHTYCGGVYRVGSHHLVDNFRQEGFEVTYLSTPVSILHIAKLYDESVRARFKILFKNIFFSKNTQLIPITLFPVSSRFFYSGILGFCKKKVFFTNNISEQNFNLILIDQPLLEFIVNRGMSQNIIYRPTDIYEEMISNKALVARCEKNILEKSTGLISTSQGVLEFLKNKYPKLVKEQKCLVVENGVDIKHFQAKTVLPEEYKKQDKFKVVYVGALDGRFGIEDVLYAAEKLACCHFFLIGNGCLYYKYKGVKLSNITFLGARAYECIPAYLQHADCTLLPMKSTEVNESRSPMKYYEYLAVGKSFICSWSRHLVARKNNGVTFYKNKEELVQCLRKAQKNDVIEVEDIQDMDWSAKAKKVLNFCL